MEQRLREVEKKVEALNAGFDALGDRQNEHFEGIFGRLGKQPFVASVGLGPKLTLKMMLRCYDYPWNSFGGVDLPRGREEGGIGREGGVTPN